MSVIFQIAFEIFLRYSFNVKFVHSSVVHRASLTTIRFNVGFRSKSVFFFLLDMQTQQKTGFEFSDVCLLDRLPTKIRESILPYQETVAEGIREGFKRISLKTIVLPPDGLSILSIFMHRKSLHYAHNPRIIVQLISFHLCSPCNYETKKRNCYSIHAFHLSSLIY